MTESSRSVASPRVVSIADLRTIAKRRIPQPVFDYLDGGAEGEITLRENCRVYEDVTFRPRHAVAFADCSLCTRVLGFDLKCHFCSRPLVTARLMHPVGEEERLARRGAPAPRIFFPLFRDTSWKM